MRPRRGIAPPLVALALFAALLVAGCGGGSDSSSSGDAGGDMQAFSDCLSEHGVDLPTPPEGGAPQGAPPEGAPPATAGDGGDSTAGSGDSASEQGTPPQPSAEDQEAFQACSQYAPSGGPPGAGAPPAPPSS